MAPSRVLPILLISVWGCGSNESGAQCGAGTARMGDECVASAGTAGTAGGGASGAGGSDGGSGGLGGVAGDSSLGGTVIAWSTTGWIDGASNPFGIQGWVWAADDCATATAADLPCVERDASLVGPDNKPGWSVTESEVCAKGTLESVTDWSKQWGFDIGINLNDSATGQTMPFDASAFRGFAADISGTVEGEFRFNVVVDGVSAEYSTNVTVPTQDATALFEGPGAIQQTSATKTPFDPTRVKFVTFFVVPQMGATKAYDFCISNFRALD